MKPYLDTSMTNERIRGTIAASNYFTSMIVLAIIVVMVASLLVWLIVMFIISRKEKRKNNSVNKRVNGHVGIISIFKK